MGDIDDELDDLFSDSPKEEKKKEEPVKKEEPIETEETEKEPEKDESPPPEPEKKEEEKPEENKPDEEEEEKEEDSSEDSGFDEKIDTSPEKEEDAPVVPEFKDDGEYDTTPDKPSEKAVIVIYGKKGDGKTYTAFTIPGSISCISFDRKSQRIAAMPEFDGRITVYDGLRYYDRSNSDEWLRSSTKSWKYILNVLDRIEQVDKPDWVCVDGGEVVHTMLEMVMRDRNNLRPFQGISNKNLWKYRRMLIGQLLSRCEQIAKLGVIWTSYITKDEIKADGDFVVIADMPKWIDAVLYETDSVVRVYRSTAKNGQQFFGAVESSKWEHLKNSPKLNITDKGMKALLSKDFLEKLGE